MSKANSSSTRSGAGGVGGGGAARGGNYQAIKELKESIEKQSGFARMLNYSMECFSKLAILDVDIEEMLTEGVVELMYAAILKHANNSSVMKEFLSLLAKFAKNERLAALIGARIPNFEFLAQSLTNNSTIEVLTAASNAVVKLAQANVNISRMKEDGIIDSLCLMVKNNPTALAVLNCGASALTCFSTNASDIANIVNSGAVRILIQAFSTHANEELLAGNVSRLLACLAHGSKDSIEQIQLMGAVDSLLNAAEFHPYNQPIVNNISTALKALTGANDMSLALKLFTGNLAIDSKFVSALNKVAGLLLVAENVDYLFKNSGIDWLISIIANANDSKDSNAEKVLATGCRALQRAAVDSEKIEEIIKCQGISVLLAVLRNHRANGKIVEADLACLAALVDNKKNAALLVDQKVITECLAALDKHSSVPDIIKPGLQLLSKLAFLRDFNENLVAAGVIQSLVAILQAHSSDESIAKATLNLLGMLSVSEENVRQMERAGLALALKKILNDNSDGLQLAQACLLALETLSMLPDLVPQLLAAGLNKAVANCLAQFNDKDLNQLGHRVQEALMSQGQEQDRSDMQAALAAMIAEEEEERLRQLADEQIQIQWKEEQRQRRMLEEAEQKKKQQDKELLHLRKLIKAPSTQPSQSQPLVKLTKSARAIFASEEEKPKVEIELSEDTKNFLWAGQLLTKHSKTAQPRQRHVYMSVDCLHINWKDPKVALLLKNRMSVYKLQAVVTGATTPQLLRKSLLGKLLANPDCSFSIIGADEESDSTRTVDLEASSKSQRDQWVRAIQEVIDWAKSGKLYGEKTLHLMENEQLYDKTKPTHV
jgi:hypothetical protein